MFSLPTITWAALLVAVSTTFAAPIYLDGPSDLVPRGALSCYPLTIDQVKTLPGWSKIQAYASANFGDGGVNIVTNPSDFPGSPASACLNVATVSVSWSGKPTCSDNRSSLVGQVKGTNQQNTFTEQIGSEQSATWTVTQTSSLTESVSFNIGIDIPDLFSAGVTSTTETTITNDRSKGFSSSSNNMQSITFTYDNASGQSCDMGIETKTCTATATGQAPIVATGWVWFNYDDSRVAKTNPNGGSHYKYAVSIDQVLSPADRTSYINFQGPVNSVSKSKYSTHCANTPPAPAKAKAKPSSHK